MVKFGSGRKENSRSKKTPLIAFATALMSYSALTGVALAEDDDKKDIIVTGKYLRAMPGEDVSGVFGFDKTITETPRSLSTISSDQLERFGITDINGLIALSPGVVTNSFFGVGGALDIRGTPGETYFRGVRRLDNPGNYPTPLGASDRIDIVRGPASPIYGPSKTGGYMNFVPKSARSADGKYLGKAVGQFSVTGGSWDKGVLSAEVTGPGNLWGQDFGYTLYAEVEDSGSYYRNIFTKQKILQAAFDTDLTDNIRLEFGGMYHDYQGVQNGGWNRLTQALVDDGTYITGAALPLDTNGDGQISAAESAAANGGAGLNPFGGFGCGNFSPFATAFDDACFTSTYPDMALTNTGTAKLKRSQVLTGPNDKLNNEDFLAYFDAIYSAPGGWEIKNQMFFERYKNINLNAYGFSQFHDSSVFEDKIVISKTFDLEGVKIATQVSPSIRHTEFKHGDDYFFEYFHRVDLTKGYDPLSDRLLSVESDSDYAEYYQGSYTDYGIAGLADITFDWGLGVLLGARYDEIEVKSTSGQFQTGGTEKESDGGASWTASVNYTSPVGLIPYVTFSKQTTTIAGQGAEISTGNVAAKTFLSTSEMNEFGVKGSFFDDRLYFAATKYEQERTDYNAQSITVNQAVKTKGFEAEMRWAATEKLLLTANYTKTKVFNLTAIEDGSLFSFFGIEDLVNVSNPTLYLGGQPIGLIPIVTKGDARRAGIPEDVYSGTATYAFDNGLSLSATASHADSVYSGQSKAVKLPSYTIVDLGATYELGNWLFRGTVKNAFDEKYFRANFTELFGSTIVLPEAPRSFAVTAIYKF